MKKQHTKNITVIAKQVAIMLSMTLINSSYAVQQSMNLQLVAKIDQSLLSDTPSEHFNVHCTNPHRQEVDFLVSRKDNGEVTVLSKMLACRVQHNQNRNKAIYLSIKDSKEHLLSAAALKRIPLSINSSDVTIPINFTLTSNAEVISPQADHFFRLKPTRTNSIAYVAEFNLEFSAGDEMPKYNQLTSGDYTNSLTFIFSQN